MENQKVSSKNIINIAIETIDTEVNSLINLKNRLDDSFVKAVRLIINCDSHVVITGMGKSGLIGKKIASTLSSTGSPSFFIHPAEAAHGDLGMLKKGNVMIAISSSGETDEILRLIPIVKGIGISIISITNDQYSHLAMNTDIHLDINITKEACPFQLVPTTSTTATLVLGDALAIALMKCRGFTPKEFAKRHPGGNLGRKLINQVKNVMSKDYLPTISPQTLFRDIISVMTRGMKGLAIVISNEEILGIITDGDVRRAIEKYNSDILNISANEIMTKNPVTVPEDMNLADAEKIMQEKKIVSLLVTEKKNIHKLVGIVQRYNL